MKRIACTMLYSLSGICIVLTVFALFLYSLGIQPFILESGSMEPLYKTGSLVLVNTNVDISDVEIGDVLIYRDGQTLVMHRLIDVNTFQGDANGTAEHIELGRSNLVGKEVMTLAYIGKFVSLLKTFLEGISHS